MDLVWVCRIYGDSTIVRRYSAVYLLTHSITNAYYSTARLLHFKSVWRLQVEDWLMLFITVRLSA